MLVQYPKGQSPGDHAAGDHHVVGGAAGPTYSAEYVSLRSKRRFLIHCCL